MLVVALSFMFIGAMQKDTLHIVGAGVIGLLTAREALAAGRAVVIWEQGEPGRQSSWAGGGILSPLYPWRYPVAVSALAAASQTGFEALCAALAAETGIDPEYEACGMLVTGSDERRAALAWADAYAPLLQMWPEDWLLTVDPAKCATLQPGLQPDAGDMLWLPRVAQVRNPRLLRALRRDLEHKGAQFRTGQSIARIVVESGAITALVSGDKQHSCRQCVISAGAWSGQLLQQTGITLPVSPVKGQMLCLATAPGTVGPIVLGREGYLVPRRDGRVLAGSTVERCGFDTAPTDAARQQLQAMAIALIPALAEAEIEAHWAGLRPGSPDDIPYIGAHPQVEGLYVCTGHYRNGIVTAPASARLIVDLILGRTPKVDPHPYRLDR